MSGTDPLPGVRPIGEADHPWLLALNNAHATQLSLLTADRLATMLGRAFYARGVGEVAALVAFDQASAHDGWNLGWFRARYDRFVYIDRVVVAPAARGRGLARALYEDLFGMARAAGQTLVTCEVNSDPPNPASDAFHDALDFGPVGSATLPDGSKTVRYLARVLTPG